jgi:hypothetical protein
LVRPNSKRAFGELKDPEAGFWDAHGHNSNFASELPPFGGCGTMPCTEHYTRETRILEIVYRALVSDTPAISGAPRVRRPQEQLDWHH